MSSFIATSYGPPWDAMQGTGTTSQGIRLAPAPTATMTGPYVVAVDPTVIPYGTKLKIWPNPFGNPNIIFQAEDTGGAIKGNRIDFYDSRGRAAQDGWGRRPVNVTVEGKNTPLTNPVTAANASAGAGAGASSSTGTSSSSGPSSWLKLLIDGALLAVGAGAIYKGGRRMIQAQAH